LIFELLDLSVEIFARDLKALAHTFLAPIFRCGAVNEFFRRSYFDLVKRLLAALAALAH